MNRYIRLTKGKYALVDNEDFEYLNQYKWHLSKNRYAASRINGRIIYMHRLLINAPENMEVDHIDNNGLNNSRSNLRLATNKQNHYNHKILSNNKSGYNGVSKTPFNTWHTSISVNNRTIHLGTYKDIEDAALAYNIAAKHYFGEFAALNKIGGTL